MSRITARVLPPVLIQYGHLPRLTLESSNRRNSRHIRRIATKRVSIMCTREDCRVYTSFDGAKARSHSCIGVQYTDGSERLILARIRASDDVYEDET